MTLTFSTIIAGEPGKSAYLRNQCDGLLGKVLSKAVRVIGRRAACKISDAERNRRSFLTVATRTNRVVGFIELRTVAGSRVFDEDLLLNAIDKPVWDCERTIEIAAMGIDTSQLSKTDGHETAADLAEELLGRANDYLRPLGIRRMVVQCRECDLDLFSPSQLSTKKLLSPNNEYQQWLGVRLDANDEDARGQQAVSEVMTLAA
ncbi:MAG: hypothetical protein AAGH82_08560 [Pseudomonadota bacterium]